MKCCPAPQGDDYMQHTTHGLLGDLDRQVAGRCYVDTDDRFDIFNPIKRQFGFDDKPTWQGNFNAYCSLNAAADECEQRPLCDGLQLAATGTVFRFRAYSTTNPAALPLMDMCDGDFS